MFILYFKMHIIFNKKTFFIFRNGSKFGVDVTNTKQEIFKIFHCCCAII